MIWALTGMPCTSGKVRYRDRIGALLALASTRHKDGSRRVKAERRALLLPAVPWLASDVAAVTD
jgi:hypothetical protein